MKYFIRILFVFVLTVAVVTGVYYYTTGNTAVTDAQRVSLTTVTKLPATEKNSNMQLLACLEKDDFYLYKSNRVIILKHDGREYEFKNWNSMIDEETPLLYYYDFDSDNEKELLIRAVEDYNEESNQFIYCLYILDPELDENGNEDYKVIYAGKQEWSKIFNEQIKLEVTQLKNCSKYVQFAMGLRSESIKYDKNTGIAKNSPTGYARALNEGAKYLTVDQMSKGNGVYTIDKDNRINVAVDINVSYKNSSLTQKIGTVYFQLSLIKSSLCVTSRSMYFVANDEYRICEPNKEDVAVWSYTENNSNKTAVADNGVIDWLKCKTQFDSSVTTQTVTYTDNTTDIDHIASITITESYVQLVAKQGCTFDANSLEKGEYSVVINHSDGNKYDIAYSTEVNANILKINFDKTYNASDIEELSLNFGVK